MSVASERRGGPAAFLFDMLRPPHRIYVIATTEGPRRLKIGVSRDPEERFRALQFSSPVGLELVAFVGGGADRERTLHERFASHRLHGEWFDGAILDQVLDAMKEIQDG